MRYESGCGCRQQWNASYEAHLICFSIALASVMSIFSKPSPMSAYVASSSAEREGRRGREGEGYEATRVWCSLKLVTNSQHHMHANECHIPPILMKRNSRCEGCVMSCIDGHELPQPSGMCLPLALITSNWINESKQLPFPTLP